MPQTLLFLGVKNDFSSQDCDSTYAPRLKQMVGDAIVYVKYDNIQTIIEITSYCKKKGITGVFTTNTHLLSKLLTTKGNPKSNPSLDNYAGSYFTYDGIDFVFIHPLKQLQTIPYMNMLMKRFISKLVHPETWMEVPSFHFDVITPANFEEVYNDLSNAYAIACDIETLKENLQIKCIGYTSIHISSSGRIETHSYVLPLLGCNLSPEDVLYNLALARRLNWETKAPKIFQKGKYDCAYMARWNCPVYNYLWDTANLFHSYYSELPKDLAFLGSFFVHKAMYWKDLAETNDLHEYFRYNALDTWTTANVWIAQMLELPEWARSNYLQEFPLQFPCHMSEMIGIKRDIPVLIKARTEVLTEIASTNESLSKMVGTYPEIYNVNSAPQNKALRTILGCGDLKSSDEIHLKLIANRHPLNARIVQKILKLRKLRKSESTYLTVNENAKELNGRILYALNCDDTDTGRLASKEHHFWCGVNIQNITRGKSIKQTFVADEGFMFAEVDRSQAETGGTAYLSGDGNLIKAIDRAYAGERDFHSHNASCFFGVPYESIYSDEHKKTLDKILRDLAKRVNHGANYLMGAQVLLDTMGEDNVWKAKSLLKLPVHWGLLDITKYLLEQFHATYPTLQSVYYPAVVHEVMSTRMLVGPTGWTRYCFDNPQKDKRAKNAYVAHMGQSLNAKELNIAYMKVFYEIALSPKHGSNFKLCAQIHDSILFQFRLGHEYLCELVRDCMEISTTIRGYDGVTRVLKIPADIKAGSDGKGGKYWCDTE